MNILYLAVCIKRKAAINVNSVHQKHIRMEHYLNVFHVRMSYHFCLVCIITIGMNCRSISIDLISFSTVQIVVCHCNRVLVKTFSNLLNFSTRSQTRLELGS